MEARMITRLQLEEASCRYWGAVRNLPSHLMAACPGFKEYLAPDTYPYLHTPSWVWLSPTGLHRYQMLQSPHVVTLLTIYALQRLEQSNE